MEGGISMKHLKGHPLTAIHSLEIGLSAVLYELNLSYGSPELWKILRTKQETTF